MRRGRYLPSDLKDQGKAYGSPRERILEAVIAIADADADDDGVAYHAAWCRFRKTLLDLGWTPPRSDPPSGEPG